MTANSKATHLKGVRIASPCTADWAAMEGDEKVRHCGACRLNVYNLSAMDVEEAAERILQDDPVCIRFYRRADGTILTRDCPIGEAAAAAARPHPAVSVFAAATALGVAAAILTPLQGARADRPAARRAILQSASMTGDVRLMRIALDAGASPDSKVRSTGVTPLMQAARFGSPDALRLLLLRRAKVNMRDKQGKTALSYARAGGQEEAAEVLLAFGATE